ncbi:hypothetical protein [Thalassobacillus hwangdonensis]|uniref:Uncharacterized protein n=1 Tax=Thalassobacillus hwangdonensis TaxID=546108 RepID=A0ABW3L3U4_9BACI
MEQDRRREPQKTANQTYQQDKRSNGAKQQSAQNMIEAPKVTQYVDCDENGWC